MVYRYGDRSFMVVNSLLSTIGWVIAVLVYYAALSAYMTGNVVEAGIAFGIATIIILTNTRQPQKIYTATLCIRREEGVFQFPLGVASSLLKAGFMIQLEVNVRLKKQGESAGFSIDDEFYTVQEREIDSSRIIAEYNFTNVGRQIL